MRYWRIYCACSGDRALGFGAAGPIQTTAVLAYVAQVEGESDRAAIERALRMVRAIDEEWLKRQPKGPSGGEAPWPSS